MLVQVYIPESSATMEVAIIEVPARIMRSGGVLMFKLDSPSGQKFNLVPGTILPKLEIVPNVDSDTKVTFLTDDVYLRIS